MSDRVYMLELGEMVYIMLVLLQYIPGVITTIALLVLDQKLFVFQFISTGRTKSALASEVGCRES